MPVHNNAKHSSNDSSLAKSRAKYFLPHARINRAQRKYCHCLMKTRGAGTVKNPYGYCRNIVMGQMHRGKHLPATKRAQLWINPEKTNCVMNYAYNDYSLGEVRALCLEKGLPISEPGSSPVKYYPKDRLVQLLTTNYINRPRKLLTAKQTRRLNPKSKSKPNPKSKSNPKPNPNPNPKPGKIDLA